MKNPRNPYAAEVSYDSHIWLPRASQNYRSFADLPDDYAAISAFIERVFPEVILVDKVRPHQRIVQQVLLSRLSHKEIEETKALCRSMGLAVMPINLLQVGSHFIPAVREKLGTSIQNPPEGIHRMQKDEPRYIGDIYSANMILSSLARLGWNIEKGKRYLDFGCSSGSLIRMFKAYEPGAEFHGIDPIPSSIEWANANIPGAYFQVSNPLPPAPHQSETFDGMTAVSIWSHLGEQEALAWFEELRRCLKPGGWLCFTTHGMISVHRYCQVKILPEKRVKAILEGLYNSNFVFEEVYIGESPEGLSATGYGNTYFTREWVTSNLSGGWDVLSYEPGMNQSNQDIYVLQKR